MFYYEKLLDSLEIFFVEINRTNGHEKVEQKLTEQDFGNPKKCDTLSERSGGGFEIGLQFIKYI